MEKRANPHLGGPTPASGSPGRVVALVLAAGLSTRMGRSKPLLPFGDQTVIEHILAVLSRCDVDETFVVVGHEHQALRTRLHVHNGHLIFNPDYAVGEMLSSLQAGLKAAQTAGADAALVALGDQPSVEPDVVAQVISAYQQGLGGVIIPSYQMRRGHPIIIDRRFWPEILALGDGQTLRDFMRAANNVIYHVTVDTPSILRDMDTPDDYKRELSAFLSQRS